MNQSLVCLILAGAATACTPLVTPQIAKEAQIAYQRDGKLPMVQVRVNGSGPYWFIVDSGASRTVLDTRLADELGLAITGRGSTTGTGTGAVQLAYAGGVTIKLGAVEYASEPYVIDLSGVPISKQVRGLVGSEIFKSHVVRIDPTKNRISIFAADRPPVLSGGAALALSVEGGKLFLPATLDVKPGRVFSRKLRIDTGSESSVNDPSAGEAIVTARTRLGGGLGESFDGVSGKFRAVRLGPYTISDVWGPGGSPSAIGMDMLQRFVVTFDAPRGRIYLKPTDRLHVPTPHPPGKVEVAAAG